MKYRIGELRAPKVVLTQLFGEPREEVIHDGGDDQTHLVWHVQLQKGSVEIENLKSLEDKDYWIIYSSDQKVLLGELYKKIADYAVTHLSPLPQSLSLVQNDTYKNSALEINKVGKNTILSKNYNGYRISITFSESGNVISAKKFVFNGVEDDLQREDLEEFSRDVKNTEGIENNFVISIEKYLSLHN